MTDRPERRTTLLPAEAGEDAGPKPRKIDGETGPVPRADEYDTRSGGEDAALIEAVISTLPSGIITTDLDGCITHINRAAAGILGPPRSQLRGKPLRALRGELEAMLWPSDKGEVLLMATGRAGELQFEETRVLGFSTRKLKNADGEPTGTVISFSDITESKAMARAEAHRQRLADIGSLVSTIAHEIRNPVFAIASLAQVLHTEEAMTNDPELLEIVGKILEEARRIGRLVDDLLAFGRERPIEKSRVDVIDHVSTLITDMQRGLLRTDDGFPVPLRLHVSPAVRRDSTWDLDPEAIRRVLSNVIRNAWLAVVARTSERDPRDGIDVRLDRGPDWLEIIVEDRGVGIPRDKLGMVFEAFYSTRASGTGLGLAIADRLVRQHRGSISLESEVGKGTTVLIRLPA